MTGRRVLWVVLTALAAAGCSGSGSGSSSGGKKGVEGQTFRLTVRGETAVWDPSAGATIVLPSGGVIRSSVGGIDCGIVGATLHKVCEARFPYGTTGVALFATPNDPSWVYGWAGACTGRDACLVDITSDRLVAVRFSSTVQGLAVHPNFGDTTAGLPGAGAVHGAEYDKQLQTPPPADAWVCTDCHGSSLQGLGLAPSCAACHAWPIVNTNPLSWDSGSWDQANWQ